MTKNKLGNRLTSLECRTIKDNRKEHHCCYVPALIEESDAQAVQARLGTPEYATYNIMVFRRLGKGFEFKIYDQALIEMIDHGMISHADDFKYVNGGLTLDEMGLMWRGFNQRLHMLEEWRAYLKQNGGLI